MAIFNKITIAKWPQLWDELFVGTGGWRWGEGAAMGAGISRGRGGGFFQGRGRDSTVKELAGGEAYVRWELVSQITSKSTLELKSNDIFELNQFIFKLSEILFFFFFVCYRKWS